MIKINFKNRLNFKIAAAIILVIGFISLAGGYFLQNQLLETYYSQKSIMIQDRNGEIIFIKPNPKGNWAQYSNKIPDQFKKLLLKKEDQHFYHHFGFNPWTTLRAARSYFARRGLGWTEGSFRRRRRLIPPSSTITQQLVKILLGNEFERNLPNKIIESGYTLSLELFQTKQKILEMYVNSVYFGNQAQGLTEASHLYFNVPPQLLTTGQILQLLTTISSPTLHNPSQPANKRIAKVIALQLGLDPKQLTLADYTEVRENMNHYSQASPSYFELRSLVDSNHKNLQLTVDQDLTKKIRKIIKTNLDQSKSKNVHSGAAVVIKLPQNELLAVIGSPDPSSEQEGHQVNMVTQPRAIGSTVKPFIYLKAFEKGLRPYTLVDDREYKYITGVGFPLYPKNFDYRYRGKVTLHYALSNSLNVPTVKVLEYVGLEQFYKFLKQDLEFEPVQDLESYQLGIALGGLEMSLLDLTKYFTIFSNQGLLKPVQLVLDQSQKSKRVAELKYIQLVNKILNDRKTGIEQFGLQSNFNLFQENYALKTGTSRDFRDSWMVGYTPDFLVGVWIGNPNNEPMKEVSGQTGAGKIWAEIMELMLNSKYNKKTPFDFSKVKEFHKNQIQYGLADDNYQKTLNALISNHQDLILKPHPQDRFLLEPDTKIILEAEEKVNWFINGDFLKQTKTTYFTPQSAGKVKIAALAPDGSKQEITIQVTSGLHPASF